LKREVTASKHHGNYVKKQSSEEFLRAIYCSAASSWEGIETRHNTMTGQAANTKQGGSMVKETIFIGMDLGTFNTSVVSSNGIREDLYTAVGWPHDHVARNLLGRDLERFRGCRSGS
jgi:hypothetical protein